MPSATTADTSPIPASTSQAAAKESSTASGPSGVPSTATNTAIPRTAPIWRLMLTTALPVAERSAGRSAVAADRMVGSASPTPLPPTSIAGRTTAAYDGSRVSRNPISATPREKSTQPAAVIHPTDKRWDSRCPMAANTGTIAGPTATPRPVRIAE
jgi:hypothetical protein